MVEGCTASCVKMVVFVANVLVFLAGAVILGFSLWTNLSSDFRLQLQKLIDQHEIEGIDLSRYSVAIWVLAVVGVMLLLVGFLGCCGAWMESKSLLGTYFTILLILFVLQTAAAVYALIGTNDLRGDVDRVLREVFKNDTAARREFEREFKCCGLDGKQTSTCEAQFVGTSCVDAFWGLVKTGITVVSIVALVAILVELVAMAFACNLYLKVHRGYTYI